VAIKSVVILIGLSVLIKINHSPAANKFEMVNIRGMKVIEDFIKLRSFQENIN
jgi:hypothetical protein